LHSSVSFSIWHSSKLIKRYFDNRKEEPMQTINHPENSIREQNGWPEKEELFPCCGISEKSPSKLKTQTMEESDKIQGQSLGEKVYKSFQSGFHCAEAISSSILDIFADKDCSPLVKAASAFGGGIAGSTGELCGAFSGGVMALGYLLGREKPGDDLRDCGILVDQFKKKFKERFGSLNCGTILDSFHDQENPLGCVNLTAEASEILAGLLNDFQGKRGMDCQAYQGQAREKVELGRCPFKAGSCGC
jgi:C_GCAxxG_C_C family probable redox protein